MAEYPFKRIKLSDPKIECIEGDTYRIAGKIAANCVDMADKVIVEAIIAMCKDEGVSELHLLDKNFVLNAIEKALAENKNIDPTADVVEVVRCKDCRHCEMIYPIKDFGKEAKPFYYCNVLDSPTKTTEFCSYGERK